MMAAFDTHAAVKRMREAGLPESQAEAISETVQDGFTGGGLATKVDLAEVKAAMATKAELAEVKADLAEVKTELKADLAEVKNDLVWIKRIGALAVALLVIPILRDFLS